MSDAHLNSRMPKADSGPSSTGDCNRSFATFGFEWSPDKDLTVLSAECAALLGLEPAVAEGAWHKYLNQIPSPDRRKLQAILADLKPSDPTYRTRYRYLTPSGRELILEEHGWAGFDPAQRLIHRRGIIADVTAERQATEELRRNEERLRQALSAAHEGSWSLDPATGRCVVSEEVRALLCLPADAPCTLQAMLRQIHSSDRLHLKACLEASTRGLAPYQAEFRVPLPGGRVRWLSARGATYAETGANIFLLGLMQDISQHKSSEEALRKANHHKDEFLAMLAHELRNPLTPVRNAAEILRMIDSDDPRLRESSRMIERQCAHMERLIEDLLDVTRIARGRLELRRETARLADILVQARELSSPRIKERGQHLDLGPCADSILLDCDPIRLCQVFTNLLENAAKYTDAGGEIRLQVMDYEKEVLVRVSDNGRGLAPDELPHLFDGLAQKRTRPAPPLAGLGLGLSIVKRLVCMHGGSVAAESPGIGQGSSFSVRLPLSQRIEPAAEHALDRSRLRILVVDDDPDVAQSTGLLLQSLGHEVDLAANAEEALRFAREQRHRLVLLDIGLGASDGLEVARRLRQLPHGRDMRIAAVTGRGDSRTRREVRAAGIDRHLLKPLSPDALKALVGSLRP